MPRIPVDLVYMQMAYQIAKLSYAKRRRVGCIIVKDKQVISTGYNGTPHGFNNDCEEIEITRQYYENPDMAQTLVEDHGFTCENGCCTKETTKTKREVLHAESNALAKVSKSTLSSEGADLYTTTCPCFDCAKLIIQSGIKKVFYSETYRDMSGVELLNKAGIEVKEVICWNAE
jgi:dCMP deaminase